MYMTTTQRTDRSTIAEDLRELEALMAHPPVRPLEQGPQYREVTIGDRELFDPRAGYKAPWANNA